MRYLCTFSNSRVLDQFEELCAPLLERIPLPIQKVLSRAGLSPAQLAAVEVVGGCSRVPCFRRKLADTLGLDQTKLNFGLRYGWGEVKHLLYVFIFFCFSHNFFSQHDYECG